MIKETKFFELSENDFYITSDTWFGRNQILQIANRPFETVEEMNLEIINRWNEKVSNEDIVLHLGNFAWDPVTAKKILSQLNGTILFILGNSDCILEDLIDDFDNIDILEDQILELEDEGVVISHYPLSVWNGKESGVFHIHGHTVFSHETDLSRKRRFNMCTDFWNYYPIKLSVLKDIIKTVNNETKNL